MSTTVHNNVPPADALRLRFTDREVAALLSKAAE